MTTLYTPHHIPLYTHTGTVSGDDPLPQWAIIVIAVVAVAILAVIVVTILGFALSVLTRSR